MIYKIKIDSFNLKDVFECGQCFRWNKQYDGTYTGIFHNSVLNVENKDGEFIFNGVGINSKEEIQDYFDLNRDYKQIKEKLSTVDENLKNSIIYGDGIRILNQDLWETIISFIISANNNIPRIKGIIERISKTYGKPIEFKGTTYYTFPTPDELSMASVADLRNLGLGFRDVRVYETTKKILNKEVDLEKLKTMKTLDVRDELLTLPGVGPKVADCILLFSTLKRFDVFPIDVWVRRVMNDLYIHNPEEGKVDKKEIQKLADEKFGDLEGIAQQYLFYWKREA